MQYPTRPQRQSQHRCGICGLSSSTPVEGEIDVCHAVTGNSVFVVFLIVLLYKLVGCEIGFIEVSCVLPVDIVNNMVEGYRGNRWPL